ncbi:MAG: hypothetical protein ACK5YI_19300, partial [Rhodospirillales bacterium]
YEGLVSGRPEAEALALRLHRELLPLIVFMTRGVPGILCYGKRVMAWRMGLETVHDRPGGHVPTPFGLAEAERLLAEVRAAEAAILPALAAALATPAADARPRG